MAPTSSSQYNQNGRLFVSIRGFVPRPVYAGAARVDSLQAQRTLGVRSNGHVSGGLPAISGSMTLRAWSDNFMRAVLLEGEDPFCDLLIGYGDPCTGVDVGMLRRALVIEDVAVSDYQAATLTTLGSEDRSVLNETFSFGAREAFWIDIPASLEVLPAYMDGALIHGLPGSIVAGASDGNSVYLLRAAPGTIEGTHALDLLWVHNGTWDSYVLGTSYAPTVDYQICVAQRHVFLHIGGATLGEPGRLMALPRAALHAGLDPTVAHLARSVRFLRMTVVDNLLFAVTADGVVYRFADAGLDGRTSQLALPEGDASLVSFAWGSKALVALSGSAYVAWDEYGRRREMVRPAAGAVAVHASQSCNDMMTFHSDGRIFESHDRGRNWAQAGTATAFSSVAYATRSVAYALVVDGAGRELEVSVSGGRSWQRVKSPATGPHLLQQVVPLADGGALVIGRQGTTGGAVDLSAKCALYRIQATKQTIAGWS